MTYVILQCGSTARGDTNPNSDVDWVCIWQGVAPDYTVLANKYDGLMFYSDDTVKRMRRKGALFLVHLDVEGLYVEGDSSLLEIFAGFRPKPSQLRRAAAESREFIKNIVWCPGSDVGWFWFLDVLYVALRNYIFCSNALEGVYSFGYVEALKGFGVDHEVMGVMLRVREGKYLYREGGSFGEVGLDMEQLEVAVSKILGVSVRFQFGGMTNWFDSFSSYYWGERKIERAILNSEYRDDGFLVMMKSHNYSKRSLKGAVKRIVEKCRGGGAPHVKN
ncbi:hypothetical protein [Pseudomonas sp. PSKL.D1]|uniref:hypothetical protein n=1 Tax=Pseudomonas sp. PSKL.D1 TaxID=3029060 RepID=UPI0023810FE6|nr:hypothetical protein [Pseudomonas sp. PSKL.D1]WDY56008.1 hypothetical protein PVV54_15510 [Pseudomonas sp. PSKL.D1]